MPRYIQEYKIGVDGGQITLPTCAKFLGVVKVDSSFVIIAEIWGNPNVVFDIDIKVFHKDEYINPKAKLLGHCIVGSRIYHFCYTEGDVVDVGGDGGFPDGIEEPVHKTARVSDVSVKLAGGMREL
jgi:hypothetical protein